ncbi:TetR/AcrR family transcriptional regulator [Tuwongella immobilis]|uniref:HTH tetR-type domain-containing protein n=1 Tax=Tuwongella immobilis TaxID=692036 RepID=A0A6C2YWJ2_9BACT|nr:TetR/AcrR family transcriptional regulator [Tuwongella immobilis]VIP05761.1 family transcriptional regulator : TetR family transcriptional regulator OS=Paenibacillus terrae (strain HPL-003) GN=HPL003_06385 PE=4 SV=1: TetR_N [Tuwongella immobilis]VTS08878.1 family transcriptional regulator : TetR family transcriptional regulator OS=Paenibacillus terrae (strain HPL-003) GN=HPL003_06385 PE=4 SV=1: TetR_N [Tuwongella immobilis]
MSRTKSIQPETLLTAATRVILNQGISALTLDAVAKEAGVSKGGVLYSFKTKDELLQALVEYLQDQAFQQMTAFQASDPEPVGRWMRSYLAAYLFKSWPGKPEDAPAGLLVSDLERLCSALFAAIVNSPQLMQVILEHDKKQRERVEQDGVDPVEHSITMLAIDGLMMGQMLGFRPPEHLYDAIIRRLEHRTRQFPMPPSDAPADAPAEPRSNSESSPERES